jgi:hypothetical protein
LTERKFEEGILKDICKKEGLTKTTCIKILKKDLEAIIRRIYNKKINQVVSNAPIYFKF